MGQAKERKARLGKWYGKPIGLGHPDFVPPKKPERMRVSRPIVRVVETVPVDPIPNATYLVTGQPDTSQNGVYTADSDGRLQRAETTQEELMHPEAVRALSGIDEAREDGLHAPQTTSRKLPGMLPKNRHLPKMAMLAILGMTLASGIDLGPAPPSRPKKR